MCKNVGSTEKGIRLILGGLLVIAAVFLQLPTWGTTILGVVGAVSVLTGTVGYCPAWSIFGINTCRVEE